MDFDSSLLREKFSIFKLDFQEDAPPVVALSNRMVCDLRNSAGDVEESFIVRAQNMHSCIRMVSQIIHAYSMGGSLLNRVNNFDWERLWKVVYNDYERKHNDQMWVAVYFEGKAVFEYGTRNPFLDVIEKCDFENDKDYDHSFLLAEEAFKKTGTTVRIEYETNVAYVIKTEGKDINTAIILRDAQQTTTFGFKISERDKKSPVKIVNCLSGAAAYLEAIQFCFIIGTSFVKMRIGLIEKGSDEHKTMREVQARLARLRTEISNLDNSYVIRYRPEKPDLDLMIKNAEGVMTEILTETDLETLVKQKLKEAQDSADSD